MTSSRQPILIIGAGISGLTLAQACRKENLPYRIFDRDESATSRSAGWGLTLNWALPHFRSLLPDDVLERLPESYVNREAVEAGEKSNFIFFDLSTGEAKWKVPITAERIRVSRERLRKLMLTGLKVEWGKTLTNVWKDGDGVHAEFADHTLVDGSFMVACDGAHSLVRRMIHPDKCENYDLPIRFIGAGVKYPESQIAEARKLDGYFFQGSDPRTDAYLWFSFLETPSDPGAPESDGEEKMYRCQVMTSWPYREGFFGRAGPSDIPNAATLQRSWMKSLSAEWAEPFHSIVHNLPRDCEIKPVELSDWIPQRNEDMVFDGRVVLLGDAAHSMVMYRGEGANHAIVDVSNLMELIKPIYQGDTPPTDVDEKFKDVVKKYESEVVKRTELAVLASRQACMDAHDYKRLNDKSPLVRRRLMKVDLENVQS